MKYLVKTILLIFLAMVVGGCKGPHISGLVETVHGEALPGVAVKIEGQRSHALTNGLGTYTIGYDEGDLTLHFIKSGYAPAALDLPVYEPREVQATTVQMWRLPASSGVFLYADGRYAMTTPFIPERFETEDGVLFGTKRPIDATTESDNPTLIIHRMPAGNVTLHRLERREIVLIVDGGRDTPVEAWVGAEALPVAARPVDYPDRMLHQLDMGGFLAPGAYAIHWGALEGNTTVESRMFMFRVLGEEPVPPSEVAADDDAPAEESQ